MAIFATRNNSENGQKIEDFVEAGCVRNFLFDSLVSTCFRRGTYGAANLRWGLSPSLGCAGGRGGGAVLAAPARGQTLVVLVSRFSTYLAYLVSESRLCFFLKTPSRGGNFPRISSWRDRRERCHEKGLFLQIFDLTECTLLVGCFLH